MEYNISCLNETNSSVAVLSNVTIISDVDEYIAQFMGSRYINSLSLGILTFIYCMIFLTGILGNGCTCIVIAKNKYMQTATNYYLFSLAVSDLLTLVLALPPELYSFWESYPWRFGEGFCIVKSFVSEMTAYASIIVLIWTIACLSALPYPLHARTFYAVDHPDTAQPFDKSLICNIPEYWRDRMKYVFQISTFVFFVAPMTIITVMYLLIGITLYKSENFGNPNQKNGKKKTSYVSSFGTSNKDKNKTQKNLKVPFNVTKARKGSFEDVSFNVCYIF
ncbi:hypothetical protein KUTeg_007371 [Tegillarca granosa]|uniref:G-protein coupled receptors family 1 profile domain-containing protein n=1 Tax=Tegillarca granosa TaxID=220873 RepID=A0ABQ9FGC8_TEGGR|nr:hypothetical protein KUTeg_007371 [Tegillarca granosa]